MVDVKACDARHAVCCYVNITRHSDVDQQQRAAAAGVGVYLESTNPRNLPFYGSCGFQRLGEFELLPDGPPAFRLWWQP